MSANLKVPNYCVGSMYRTLDQGIVPSIGSSDNKHSTSSTYATKLQKIVAISYALTCSCSRCNTMLELTSFGGVRAVTRDAIKRIFACAPSNLEVTPSSTSSSILTDQFHDSQDAGMSELPACCAVHARLPPVQPPSIGRPSRALHVCYCGAHFGLLS
jgi:hypothetical protein